MLPSNLDTCKRVYFLCGNARTFVSCFDSIYTNVIDKLFSNNTRDNTHILFYLKCDDPGPKGQRDWDFEYPLINEIDLTNKVIEFTKKYTNITFHSEILPTNKISDNDLFAQLKDRTLYTKFLSEDSKLLRALHCHYNIEDCGKIINQIETHNAFNFDFYIYIRPDLFFQTPCQHISKYNIHKVTLGEGPNSYNNDHIAIIPHKYNYAFFYERMELIRTNQKTQLVTSEEIYWHTIKGNYEVKRIGKYMIKRS